MNRKKFVVTTSVLMVFVAGTVAGLAVYTNFVVKASVPGLPEAVAYLPADAQAVFGMNVKAFVKSPIFAKFQAKHGQEVGQDLAEIIDKTGVDPRTDIDYVVAAGKPGEAGHGKGVVVATGRFNRDKIVGFIKTKTVPIELEYSGASVVMIPENKGNEVDKGIAFLSQGEVAVGDLESLKKVVDARPNGKGVLDSPVLGPLLKQLNPQEMFWFAGDATSVISKAPTNTPLGNSISAIQYITGTLDLTDAVKGRISVTARDQASAQKLADVAKGLVALGQLASDQNADLGELMKGVSIQLDDLHINLKISFPYELLEKLESNRAAVKKTI
jgi:hypothetical protein